jgi:hypothetical protein
MDFKDFNKKLEDRLEDTLEKIESTKLAKHLMHIYQHHQVNHEKLKPEIV